MSESPMNETWDAALEAVRQLSEMLTGMVRTLTNEGWSEPQARDLVVASYVSNVRAAR